MAEFSSSIDIDAPPQQVFAFLVTDEGMRAWMGQHAELDARPGGRFAVDIAGHPVRGRFLEVEPHSRVVVSWGFAGSDELPAGASTVAFTLTLIASGTRVDVLHSDLPETAVEGHAHGWRHFLPRLAAVALGDELEPDDWTPLGD